METVKPWSDSRTNWRPTFLPTTEAVLPTVYGRNVTTVPLGLSRSLKSWLHLLGQNRSQTANGKVKSDIDYDSVKETGRSLSLAIGGDKLSRGLTLEGLSVSLLPAHLPPVRQPFADGPLVRLSPRLCRSLSAVHDRWTWRTGSATWRRSRRNCARSSMRCQQPRPRRSSSA